MSTGAKPAKHKSYIYFIYAPISKRMKIGYTKFFTSRLQKIQANCPEKLEVLRVIEGDCRLERKLHLFFADERSHGEWFQASDTMVEFAKSLEDHKLYKDIFDFIDELKK